MKIDLKADSRGFCIWRNFMIKYSYNHLLSSLLVLLPIAKIKKKEKL